MTFDQGEGLVQWVNEQFEGTREQRDKQVYLSVGTNWYAYLADVDDLLTFQMAHPELITTVQEVILTNET
jgi:hypothetical protein